MKKLKWILFVFIVMIGNCLSGQSDVEEDLRKFSMGFNLSVNSNYRRLDKENGRNRFEKPRAGSTTGISVGYKFKKNVICEVGIQSADYGYQMQETIFGDMVLTQNSFQANIWKAKFNYLTIPLMTTYIIGKGRLSLIIGGGVAPGILYKAYWLNTSRSRFTGSFGGGPSEIKINGSRKFNLTMNINIGIRYYLNERVNLRIQPNAGYGLLSVTDFPKEHLYSTGVNMGLYIDL